MKRKEDDDDDDDDGRYKRHFVLCVVSRFTQLPYRCRIFETSSEVNMGLFDGLPSASTAAAAVTSTSNKQVRSSGSCSALVNEGPDRKRAKKDRGGSVRFGDECGLTKVTANDALKRIERHISQPAKCFKSCQLLVKLIDGGQLNGETSSNFFKALRSAMADTSLSAQPELRRVYRKLFLKTEANIEEFSEVEQSWIKEYSLLAIVRNELYTDDSFLFNKRCAFVKKQFQLLQSVKVEDSPKVSEDKVRLSWHLKALVDCLEAAKSVYGTAWTRSATDLLAQTAFDCQKYFDNQPELRERLLAVVRFVQNAKNDRKLKKGDNSNGGHLASKGNSGGEDNTFDSAVEIWKKKEGISKRSGQGGGESWRGTSSLLG